MAERYPFKCFKASPDSIRVAIMADARFPQPGRTIEGLRHDRGVDVGHETNRHWWHSFGPIFAAEIRKGRFEGLRSGRWRWHLEKMVVKIKEEMREVQRASGHRGKFWRSVSHHRGVASGNRRMRSNKARSAMVANNYLANRFQHPIGSPHHDRKPTSSWHSHTFPTHALAGRDAGRGRACRPTYRARCQPSGGGAAFHDLSRGAGAYDDLPARGRYDAVARCDGSA